MSYRSPVAFDFDEDFRRTVETGIEMALEGLTPEDLAKVEENSDAILSTALSEAIEDSAKLLVEQLHRDAPAMIEHRRNWHSEVDKHLAEHWGKAFDLTEMVIRATVEIGEFFYEKHVPPDGERDYTFEALARLLARACRIAEEVLVLLKAGYGQAGLARWRALEEVTIVAEFITANGDDCAERYFAHEAIESWNGMVEFQQHAESLGETPFTEAEVAAAKRRYDDLIERYGPTFAGHYGWAQAALEEKDPTFTKGATLGAIQESVGTEHMRPYYRMASYPIHAGPKGVMWSPDQRPSDGRETLLTGPSPAGLADAGHGTLISLTRVLAATLISKQGEATALLISVAMQLTSEAGDAFLEAHQNLEAGLQSAEVPAPGTSTRRSGSVSVKVG